MPDSPRPLRVAVVNDLELIIAGLRTVLEGVAAVDTVPPSSMEPNRVAVAGVPAAVAQADVVLYDTFGDHLRLQRIRELREAGVPVVIFGWQPPPRDETRTRPVVGFVSKLAQREELIGALIAAANGVTLEVQGAAAAYPGSQDRDQVVGTWPGAEHGLTAREAEVLSLVAKGRSNPEIGTDLFLGLNTVKTYIRTAYRKIGVQRRSQAVRWAIEHGLSTDPRTRPPGQTART